MSQPWKIGLTVGDPSGIGPEIAAAALRQFSQPGVEIVPIGPMEPISPGKPGPSTSRLALAALEEAARLALDGSIHAIVTGPVSKHQLHQVGFIHPGQTEFFAAKSGTRDFTMILTGGPLTVGLATVHVPLAEVPPRLTTASILRTGRHLAEFCRSRGIDQPRIAMAGLNPHAGENGDLGHEELTLLAPALATLQSDPNAFFSGPWSPDTVFYRAARGEFDAVLCQYHDQGLIPLKLLAFDQGVNVTWGLPFLRASPDHGTAYDIAGQGVARPDSLLAALELAASIRPRRI
jgi:4-hydroxythreonine-4-phosphate dehydrogenase